MSIQVNIGEAKTRLSELVAASLRGEQVVLSKAGEPIAEIIPIEAARARAEAAAKAERKAKMKAWIGSGKGKLGPNAGDAILEPAYTDGELDEFEAKLDWS